MKAAHYYRIRKGAKLYPFTWRPSGASDYGWAVYNRYKGNQLYAKTPWYFSSQDLLPMGVQGVTRYYVMLSQISNIGNAFDVDQEDVEDVTEQTKNL